MLELIVGITLWNVWLAVGGFICDRSLKKDGVCNDEV